MDWARAIDRNSQALKSIVMALFVLLGDVVVAKVPQLVHRAVLRVLGPAEAATRRLIVIVARGLAVKPLRPRLPATWPSGPSKRQCLAFRLFDPRKSFVASHGRRLEPRIHNFGGDPRVSLLRLSLAPAASPVAPVDDGLADACRLHLRLQALTVALEDLSRQARRLLRLRARRAKAADDTPASPLRPGPPPGHRKFPHHAVDSVLAECHGLARDAMALDTS